MSYKTGGPAFPCKYIKHKPNEVGNSVAIHEESEGMTLRDYFAAKAMQGDWAAQSTEIGLFGTDTEDKYIGKAAKLYYRMADAMIAERNKDQS